MAPEPYEEIAALRELVREQHVEIERLTAALKDMFALMDEGLLVRDMSHDNDPMWAVRQIKFVQRLCEANALLFETTP